MDQSGNVIDNYTSCLAVGPNPNTINNITLMNPNITVSTNFTPTISFISTDLMNQNDTLRITLNCQSIIPANMNNLMIISTSTFNYTNSAILQSSLSLNSSYYGYYLPKMTGLTYVSANSPIYLTNISFIAPTTTMPSNCLTISFYRNGNLYSTGNLTLTPLSNVLKNVSLTSSSKTINLNTNFTISFLTSSPLSSTAYILITIPTSISTTPYTIKSCVDYNGDVANTVTC